VCENTEAFSISPRGDRKVEYGSAELKIGKVEYHTCRLHPRAIDLLFESAVPRTANFFGFVAFGLVLLSIYYA
jgi:hypothetical protein